MFGFPVNLFDGGLTPVKFTPDANSGFPKIQQREIFYSKRNGFFDDPTTWETASGRVGLLPTKNDDVYIRNDVINRSITTETFNLFISGKLIHDQQNSQRRVTIYGNLKIINGFIDFRTGNVQQLTIYIHGNNNLINDENLIFNPTGANGTIGYVGNTDQNILPLQYRNLITLGTGTKWVQSNLNILGSLDIQAKTEFSTFDLIVNGNTNVSHIEGFSKVGFGNLLFIGNLRVSQGATFDLSQGNANVELRGGLDGSITPIIKSGTGTWSFTTNNQSIFGQNGNCSIRFNGNVIIGSGVTLLIQYCQVLLIGTINGTNGTSKLINGFTNQTTSLVFETQNSCENSMSIGTFDFTTYTSNTIQYSGNYTATIPSYFPTFHNLTISGTGTKSLGVNTTLNGILFVNNGGDNLTRFECLTFDLVVNGETRIDGTFSKNGAGNLLFVGLISVHYTMGLTTTYFLLSGNPNVEFRNGFTQNLYYGFFQPNSLITGTGTWKFSTNNQVFNIRSWARISYFNANILVSGNITLSYGTDASINGGNIHYNGIINGDSTNSKFLVVRNLNFSSSNITPMATGIFDYLTNSTSVLGYYQNTNISLPYNTYNNLIVSSTSTSTKSLSANTIINNNFVLASPNQTFECGIYNLSIFGTTTNYGTLSKTGSGNLLFVGLFLNETTDPRTNIVFSGNPNVEFRGGFDTTNYYGIRVNVFNSGTGTWSFTTNNQIFNLWSSLIAQTFSANILISGAITLNCGTMLSANFQQFVFTGTINGNNANSKMLMGLTGFTSFNYQNATQPMATGILDTSTNANTWIYGNLNQDIKGSPTTSPKQVYRNLTLNGTGVKTLQGYVSVLNTYTLTAPATLANNGYTLTNP
jgi:hypothetical protein